MAKRTLRFSLKARRLLVFGESVIRVTSIILLLLFLKRLAFFDGFPLTEWKHGNQKKKKKKNLFLFVVRTISEDKSSKGYRSGQDRNEALNCQFSCQERPPLGKQSV